MNEQELTTALERVLEEVRAARQEVRNAKAGSFTPIRRQAYSFSASSAWPELLEAVEAAAFIGHALSPERLVELAETGYVPSVRVEGRWLFNPHRVAKWVSKNIMQESKGRDFPLELAIIPDAPSAAPPDAVPPQLAPLQGHLHSFRQYETPPCVYFLIYRGKVVYVGQTVSLAARIATHREQKTFDRVVYLAVPRSDLDAVEAAFIRAFTPKLNGNEGCATRHRDAEILARYGVACPGDTNP